MSFQVSLIEHYVLPAFTLEIIVLFVFFILTR